MSDTTQEATGMAGLQDLIIQSMRDVRAGTLDVGKAKAVNALAQTLINSAKVEVEFLRATKSKQSRFFQAPEALPAVEPTHSGNGTLQRVANGPWQGLVHRPRDDDDE